MYYFVSAFSVVLKVLKLKVQQPQSLKAEVLILNEFVINKEKRLSEISYQCTA